MDDPPHSRSSSPATPSSHSSPSSSEFHPNDQYSHNPFGPWDLTQNTKDDISQHVGATWDSLGLTGFNREDQGLMLEELISADAFDPVPSPSIQPQHIGYRQPFSPSLPVLPAYPSPTPAKGRPRRMARPASREDTPAAPADRNPPPVFAPSASGSVVPSKLSLSNLPIIIHNVPQHGAKSRVETQIKMTLDLALPSDDDSYERVGSWRWLKLPKGTATRKRPRKDLKIDAHPDETLNLNATVHCASAPSVQVYSCTSCLAREAKRNERKKAARIRPERRSESGSDAEVDGVKTEEGGEVTGIVMFNCTEVVDFSTGSVVLPVRVTCYCRHHREKVGFCIVFTMTDSSGRVIGKGTTPPIMITDDHKSTKMSLANAAAEEEMMGIIGDDPTKRKRRYRMNERDCDDADMDGRAKRRVKSYPSTAAPSPAPTLPEVASSSKQTVNSPLSAPTISSMQNPPAQHQIPHPASPVVLPAPADLSPSAFLNYAESSASDMLGLDMVMASLTSSSPMQSPPASTVQSTMQSPLYFPNPPPPPQLPPPQIHRLIPSSGPTHGGIEVTILGSNFLSTHQCVFGDTLATSTQLWSENTIVCILPPSASPGPVVVGFKGVPICGGGASGSLQLFNYLDNSDRALMELALQVVGLKMTGRIEEAKSIAMRIVGTGSDGSGGGFLSSDSINHSVHQSRDSSVPQSRRGSDSAVALSRLLPMGHPSSGNGDFQSVIIDFLTLLDVDPQSEGAESVTSPTPMEVAISHPNPTGQTLLHLAALLGFHRLLSFLLARGIDVNARDNNGFTALHFAALCGRVACARLLCEGGADVEIVEGRGKTPKEIAHERDQADVETVLDDYEGHRVSNAEAEAEASADADESAAEEANSTDDDGDWWATKGEKVSEVREQSRHLGPLAASAPALSGDLSSSSSPSSEDEELPEPEEQSEPVLPIAPIASPDVPPNLKPPSFLYRTLSHLQPPPGVIPGMIPALPPWALPQIPLHLPEFPLSFPVQVPMPTWPAALQWQGPWGEKGPQEPPQPGTLGVLRVTYEFPTPWRSAWWGSQGGAEKEKEALGGLVPGESGVSGGGVPMYAPAPAPAPALAPAEVSEPAPVEAAPAAEPPVGQPSQQQLAGVQKAHIHQKLARRLGYEPMEITDREINAYTYHSRKYRKLKRDNMLVLFWLPILLFGLAWALYRSVPPAFSAISYAARHLVPVRDHV
ncbi:hypothetical protein BOTBODRAFT_183153 [Botryobasidium botryosum FD-172 SS1]|uniref:IPT/TIG domain-containing protein n=1 Tax=Botryobasidium botryosum (strain FD-172 SS1) TaxID=930990 RepID=A0A067N4Q9_BOTB1|nr:hypothetical protein BOTBODRAFT_183153 [Botryobasidium botryosum FD-172 SS1]